MTFDATGLYGDCLAVVEEAQAYNYSPTSAFTAAMDHLELADVNEARMIAAVLASWIACDLNPTGVTNLAEWIAMATAVISRRAER